MIAFLNPLAQHKYNEESSVLHLTRSSRFTASSDLSVPLSRDFPPRVNILPTPGLLRSFHEIRAFILH